MGLQQISQTRLSFGVACDRWWKVSGREDVCSGVIGEKYLTGLESGCRCERAATGRTGVVRQMRRITVVARYQVRPTGNSAHRQQHQQTFQLGQRQRLMLGLVLQSTIWNGCAAKKSSRAPAEECVCQWKSQYVFECGSLALG